MTPSATSPETNPRNNQRLDRAIVVPRVIGDHRDFLIVSGLAGAAKDVHALEEGADNAYLLGGAMGAAVPMGLGLALAQPDRHVLVVTGDGELLMNVGALATVMVAGVSRFSILCVDNERYGETGNQITHTAMGVDLAMVARGFGIRHTMAASAEDEFDAAKALLRRTDGPVFVHLKISDTPPPKPSSRSFDAVERKLMFRKALLGHV
ncbi:MAG: thiamine pyrophosphate-binding protein [Alphaproteobacteria bacterium]|nr:thiamine pyrophosphate-binding protein [Alphaproteobacteria bacterium]